MVHFFSLFVKGALMFGALILGAGCGFQSLYAPQVHQNVKDLEYIQIAAIADREGQVLRNALQDVLHPERGGAVHPRYRLEVQVSLAESSGVFRKDSTASRLMLTSVARFQLIDIKSRRLIYQHQAEVTTSFGVAAQTAQSAFPTVTALRKEKERSMHLLAQEIKNDLAAFLVSDGTGPMRRSSEALSDSFAPDNG